MAQSFDQTVNQRDRREREQRDREALFDRETVRTFAPLFRGTHRVTSVILS